MARSLQEEGQAFDLVIGAKGSPLQLVLSSVYFMDQPTGNVSYALYEQVREDSEYVEAVFPVSMGDSYRSYRIVGTVPELFGHTWQNARTGAIRQPFRVVDGEMFDAPMEAVLGAVVAQQTGLQVGDTFVSSHGFIEVPEGLAEYDHSDHPYTVVGLLDISETPFDRAIYTTLDSVWVSHEHGGPEEEQHEEHDREVTALLVQLQSPGYRWQYKELIRDETNAMAAVPIEEIKKLYDQFLGTLKTVLLAVGYLVVIISSLSILIGLYLSILQRRRDLAVMRALGASAYEIFGVVIIEAFWVTMLGIVCGWFLGAVVTQILGLYLAREFGLVIAGFSISREAITAFAVVAIIGLLAGILPAYQAYNRDVARDLADL